MADRLHETPRNVQLEGCKFKRNFWKKKKFKYFDNHTANFTPC